jgi:Mg2+/Co2+ transporter CorB
MKLRRKHIIIIAPGILTFVIIAFIHIAQYLVKHHATKIESDYFLIAIFVFGTFPFILALLYVVHSYLQQLKEKQQAEEEKKFYSDYIKGKK